MMTQWAKALAGRPVDVTLILGTCMVEEQNRKLSFDLCVYAVVHMCARTHIHIRAK